MRSAIAMLTFLSMGEPSIAARSCDGHRLDQVDLGSIHGSFAPLSGAVLSRTYKGETPYVVHGNCVQVEANDGWKGKLGNYLYFSLVNLLPDTEGADAFLRVQAIRERSEERSLIRMYRNANWVGEDGSALSKLPGRVARMSIEAWDRAHADEVSSLEDTNENLGVTWHAWPGADTVSSWDFREYWRVGEVADWEVVFTTNYLLRFGVNSDEMRLSEVPFEVGINGANLIVLRIGTSADGVLDKTIKVRIGR
jgi:hypothetical protein